MSPTCCLFLLRRDTVGGAGITSSFRQDAAAIALVWTAVQGRSTAVLAQHEAFAIVAFMWQQREYAAAMIDFHRQCNNFGLAWIRLPRIAAKE